MTGDTHTGCSIAGRFSSGVDKIGIHDTAKGNKDAALPHGNPDQLRICSAVYFRWQGVVSEGLLPLHSHVQRDERVRHVDGRRGRVATLRGVDGTPTAGAQTREVPCQVLGRRVGSSAVGDVAGRVGTEGLVEKARVEGGPGGAILILFIAQDRISRRVRDGCRPRQQAAKEEELGTVGKQGAVFVVRSPVVGVSAAGAQRAEDGRDVLGGVERGGKVERVNQAQPVVCQGGQHTSHRRAREPRGYHSLSLTARPAEPSAKPGCQKSFPPSR